MTPNEIFERALEMGTKAYHGQRRLKWGISVCATPIQIGKGMILGINWGGGGPGDKHVYESQQKMPTLDQFKADFKNGSYGFLTRSADYLKKYPGIDVEDGEFNYTNLCLFRSPNQKFLLTDDYESCFDTFKFLVAAIEPPWILSLGTGNVERIKALIPAFSPEIETAGRATGRRDKLLEIPFYCVPHPNAHLSKPDRDGIWEKVFSDKSN